MTDGKDPGQGQNSVNDSECGIKAVYGLYIAMTGLLISGVVAIAMILADIRAASDLVSVIAVFTGLTMTLTGYFFGEKSGSSGKADTENKLSRTVDELISQKSFSAIDKGRAELLNSENKVLSTYVNDAQKKINESSDLIEKVSEKIKLFSMSVAESPPDKRGPEKPFEMEDIKRLDKALLLLKEAKVPKEILDLQTNKQ
ncbi:hypothetical protein J2128_000363 [Methanomicrobium sp. W14]|uniref:hypothetical protein n=1 Tax=Methanomicrobium sp. W14 TaxID=2817839 RepID=UPI001AEB44F2|nr:hypothetical protein [Methanomicrobium sp. W14]MBP2132442.1 hypothetical protein [Methanomicrobium sp. W14]